MIIEDYVSFETAKLLKEKGFNEPCECAYSEGGQYRLSCYKGIADRRIKNDETLDFSYSSTAPTLQVAMKWLRKNYKLHIEPHTTVKDGELTGKWHCFVKFLVGRTYPLVYEHVGENYASYEEACEAGIKYCLENLI